MNARWSRLVAGALGAALVPVSWWLVGDLSSTGFDSEELDYFPRAPDVFERDATAAALVEAAVAVALVAVLIWMYTRGDLSHKWLLTVLAAAASGAFLGFAARTFTAGGIGANIGASLIMMILLAGVTGWVLTARRLKRSGT